MLGEEGCYGDEDYSRALTADKQAAIAHWRFEDAPDPTRDAEERAEAEALRAAYFAAAARERGLPEGSDNPSGGDALEAVAA